jgi:hypothetical protein
MSLSAISTGSLSNIQSVPSSTSKLQQFRQGFQQLGQDLESGNLASAQQDFTQIKTDIKNPLRPAPVYPVGPAPRDPVILSPTKRSVTA